MVYVVCLIVKIGWWVEVCDEKINGWNLNENILNLGGFNR